MRPCLRIFTTCELLIRTSFLWSGRGRPASRRYNDVPENVVRERNRTPIRHQPLGSFLVHAPVAAENPEVRASPDY